MDPITIAALSSVLGPLLGGLFRGKDPADALRQKLGVVSNPQNLLGLTNQFYQAFLGSPAFSQAQGNIASGQNTALQGLRQSLGARGLTTSGIGSVAPALAQSGAANQLAQLRAGGYSQAQNAAQQSIQQQIQALLGGGAGQNTQGSLVGAGLSSFAKFLQQYYLNKALGGGEGGGGDGGPSSFMGQPGWSYPIGGR